MNTNKDISVSDYIAFTGETITVDGHILHRIEVVKEYKTKLETKCLGVGLKGGYVETLDNIIFGGFVYGNARVYGDAKVEGGVYEDATVCERAYVGSEAVVHGSATVGGDVEVIGQSVVGGSAHIYGRAMICDYALVDGNATVYDHAVIKSNARVNDDATICGDAYITGEASVGGKAFVGDFAIVRDYTVVFGDVVILNDCEISGFTSIFCKATIERTDDVMTFREEWTKGGEYVTYVKPAGMWNLSYGECGDDDWFVETAKSYYTSAGVECVKALIEYVRKILSIRKYRGVRK